MAICGSSGNFSGMAALITSNTGGGQSHDHTLSANFVGSSTSTLSPYLVLIYIIKT
jgi:mRNA-degrading endonuclease YafQ of YafQ-DinJ toxin-antitoxin module